MLPDRSKSPPPSTPSGQRGPLIAIGGAEDKVGDRAVLREVVKRAGGKKATIAVFPTASSIPHELAPLYSEIFRGMGAEVRTIWINTRADGEDPAILKQLEGVTAIFFTGGAQGRIVTLLGGTPLAQAIRRAYRSGALVAGTSAGASVVCDHMIVQGKSGYAPKRRSVTLAPGFGLTKRLVIDQHFAQRHRIGRLLAAVALNPFLLGVGIDEDTAIVISADNKLEVIGRGTVTVIDGAKIVHTDIHETLDTEPAALLGVHVHVLTGGYGFDIETRAPIWQGRVAPVRAPRPSAASKSSPPPAVPPAEKPVAPAASAKKPPTRSRTKAAHAPVTSADSSSPVTLAPEPARRRGKDPH